MLGKLGLIINPCLDNKHGLVIKLSLDIKHGLTSAMLDIKPSLIINKLGYQAKLGYKSWLDNLRKTRFDSLANSVSGEEGRRSQRAGGLNLTVSGTNTDTCCILKLYTT